jgi:hypothetical protein
MYIYIYRVTNEFGTKVLIAAATTHVRECFFFTFFWTFFCLVYCVKKDLCFSLRELLRKVDQIYLQNQTSGFTLKLEAPEDINTRPEMVRNHPASRQEDT